MSSRNSLPPWLRRPSGTSVELRSVKKLLRNLNLNTVCEDARCPNIQECFLRKTATFLILGDICTRRCKFCSVKSGVPFYTEEDFLKEAKNVVQAVKKLNLKHVVITSVTRDDLKDGGASGFCFVINELKKIKPALSIEVLIPDFCGNWDALKKVVNTSPSVLNHNLETISRLYSKVRPQADYYRSLELLEEAKKQSNKLYVKTGIMLGLGESKKEVIELMKDAYNRGVDMFTAGQYMQPTRKHLKVEKYLSEEEFKELREEAHNIGFKYVYIAPLVRSSYNAKNLIN